MLLNANGVSETTIQKDYVTNEIDRPDEGLDILLHKVKGQEEIF